MAVNTMNDREQVTDTLGFRRVQFVRLLVDERGTIAEVTGIVHRYPRTIRVPLRAAQALIASGVPRRVEVCGRQPQPAPRKVG